MLTDAKTLRIEPSPDLIARIGEIQEDLVEQQNRFVKNKTQAEHGISETGVRLNRLDRIVERFDLRIESG